MESRVVERFALTDGNAATSLLVTKHPVAYHGSRTLKVLHQLIIILSAWLFTNALLFSRVHLRAVELLRNSRFEKVLDGQ